MRDNWKTVRVFISSTFRDMHAERDHLVRFVFPKLRQELVQRRIHLVDVDLRWGVTSEQDALSVCREVVDECRPRFLCMLGGRYGWVPPGRTRSITAAEIHYGVLDRDHTSRGFAYFYFRDPSATAAMAEVAPGEFREPAGSHGAVALAELKTAIVESGLQPFIYRAQWDDQSRRLIGLKELGDRVYVDLKQSIDQEFGPTTGEKPDEFTEEKAAMEAFIEERVQRFVLGSRQPVWNELQRHAESTGGNGYLCLTGESGSGKSALLGKFCQDYRATHPQDLVIPHFAGASPGSTDVRRALRRLCQELAIGAALTAEIPEDPEKLRVAFAEILQQASAQKRVVILLDAINQFDPTTQFAGWSWLPEELPAKTRIILSTLSGPVLESLRRRRQPPLPVELQPLDAPDRQAIIREFLHRYRKSMTDDQRAALLAKADAGTPLYLLVALEELRTLGTYEEITDRIAQLPPDTRALFIWILKRLQDDDGFRDASGRKIGQELVSRFVSLLGASRHGLSQQELRELLSPGDPQGNVAALAQLLRPYLMQRGELLDFYHGQFRQAAFEEYGNRGPATCHAEIAAYFDERPNWVGREFLPLQAGKPDSRKAGELPWQLSRAREPVKLARVLGDIGFLEAKISSGLSLDLLDDFQRLDELCRRQAGSTAEQELFRETFLLWRLLGNTLDQVMADPASIGMQLGLELQNIGAASSSQPREAAMLKRLDLATNDRPCFNRFSGGRGVPYLAQTAMRQEFLHLVRFSPDGNALLFCDGEGRVVRWKWSAPVIEQTKAPTAEAFRCAAMVPDGSIAFGGLREVWMFSTECLWNERFRDGVWRQVTASEKGTRLGAVAGSPSGMLLVGQSGVGVARILRFRGVEPVKAMRMPYSERDPDVSCMAVNANGQTVAAGFSDGMLAISTGFRGVLEQGGLKACAFLDGDSLVASLGSQGVLSIRDMAGQVRREVPLVHGNASCLAYSPRHKVIAVGHQNGYVSLVPLDGSDFGTTPGFWPGVRGEVASLDFSESGQYLATGGSQGVVRVFEVGEIQRAGRLRSLGERGAPAGPIREVAFVNAREGLAFLDRRQRLRTNSADSDSRYLPFGAQCFCYDRVRDRLVAARNDEIYFLEPRTGKVENQEQGHANEPRVMAMSADGRFMAQRQDTRLLIYEIRRDGTAMERRFDLFLTPFLASATRTLNRAPLRFLRNGTLLACPLESTAGETDLRRTLLLVDTASGEIAGSVQYSGFCTALDELPEEDILIVGLGRGVVGDGEREVLARSPDDALLFCSTRTGERLQSRILNQEDLGVTGIAVERENNFKGCIVVAFESGRLRLTSLRSDLWAASICLPDAAAAVRFYRGTVQVADNGSRKGHWPAIHEFTLHFPISNKQRLPK
jgi:WD40 repeat protein